MKLLGLGEDTWDLSIAVESVWNLSIVSTPDTWWEIPAYMTFIDTFTSSLFWEPAVNQNHRRLAVPIHHPGDPSTREVFFDLTNHYPQGHKRPRFQTLLPSRPLQITTFWSCSSLLKGKHSTIPGHCCNLGNPFCGYWKRLDLNTFYGRLPSRLSSHLPWVTGATTLPVLLKHLWPETFKQYWSSSWDTQSSFYDLSSQLNHPFSPAGAMPLYSLVSKDKPFYTPSLKGKMTQVLGSLGLGWE